MKICQAHWNQLRTALKARGIDHLGAKSGEQAIDNIVEEVEGGLPPYDPTMDCNNMIWSRGLELGGLYLMGVKEDGSDYCPICEALDHMAPPPGKTRADCERWWIDGPADAALARCRDLNLVPAVQ